MGVDMLSCCREGFFVTCWTVAHQAPLSMGFFRQEYWKVLLFPPSGDLPDSGIKPTSPVSPALQADSLPLSPKGCGHPVVIFSPSLSPSFPSSLFPLLFLALSFLPSLLPL